MRLRSLLINYMGDNISKYVCPTIIIEIARKIVSNSNEKNTNLKLNYVHPLMIIWY